MTQEQEPYADATQARAALGEVVQRADEQAERARRYAAAVADVRVAGRHVAGARVTLDHAGGLVGLEVDDRLASTGGDRVARAVLAAVQVARARLPEALDALACDAFGSGSATTAHLREVAVRTFGAPTPSPARTALLTGGLHDGVLR